MPLRKKYSTTIFFADVKDIVFVILSQPNKYHAKLAHDIKDDLHKQAAKLHFKVKKITQIRIKLEKQSLETGHEKLK